MTACVVPIFWWKIPHQIPSEATKPNEAHLLVDDNNKYKSMWIRTYSTLWMIGGFVFIIYMGHLYICAMVIVIQILMARELFNLLRKVREDRHLPGFRLLNWWGCKALILYGFNNLTSFVCIPSRQKWCILICSSPFFRHFFFTVMLFVYGRILSQRLVNTVTSDKVLYKLVSSLIKYHMVICYSLYIAGNSAF